MEWTTPENVTVGVVMFAVIGLLAKFLQNMGQRTDPKLLEVIKLQAESNAASDKARDKTYDRLSGALDRNTDTLDTVKSGIESSFTAFAQSIQQIVGTITTEHAAQVVAIEGIPKAIIPAIDTLTQQLKTHNMKVAAMTDSNGNNQEAIQQILAAVLRLETRMDSIGDNFETFQAESQVLGTEIKETRQELTAIKDDVEKLKPTEQIKGKTNVQSIEQPARLDSIGSDNRSSDRDHSGDSSKTVPPRAAGTDTEQRDDQSKPAI